MTLWAVCTADCRSPHGERGLKCPKIVSGIIIVLSLPTRGAWIEICSSAIFLRACSSRSPHGERGLKSCYPSCIGSPRRSPHGERGLKCSELASALERIEESLPTRGAWIEIPSVASGNASKISRSPHGERGLKFPVSGLRAWLPIVAPHTGSVD